MSKSTKSASVSKSPKSASGSKSPKSTKSTKSTKSAASPKSPKSGNRAKQARNMQIRVYCPLKHVQSVIDYHRVVIRAYAYILHDKFTPDELGDKDKKEPHIHIVLRLTRPFTESAVSKWFTYYNDDGLLQSVLCQSTNDYVKSFEYLTHKHDPQKYQFSSTDVYCNSVSSFRRNGKNPDDDNAINALDDMLDDVPIYDICLKYGRDVIYHLPQLKYAFDLIYYGKEFQEVKKRNCLMDKSRPAKDINRPFTSVSSLDNFFKGEFE